MHSRDVLRRFSEEDWRRLTVDLATSIAARGWPDHLTEALAKAIRFRPQTLRTGDPQQRARLLRRALTHLRPNGLFETVFHLHRFARQPLVMRVHEIIAQVIGRESTSVEEPLPVVFDVGKSVAGILALDAESPPNDLHLCLSVAVVYWRSAWVGAGPLADALETALVEELQSASAPVAPPQETPRLLPATPDAPPPQDVPEIVDSGLLHLPSFTTLDTVLIRATVSSINGVMGSLDRDQLDDLMLEIVEMNDSRHQSWFHRGFLDALQERALSQMQGGENRQRRAWRLAGYFLGLLRRRPDAEVLLTLTQLSRADRDVLLADPAPEAGAMLAPVVILPLLKEGQIDEALAWMRAYLVPIAPRVVPGILEWARLELVRGEAASVRRVLETVRERSDAIYTAHGDLPGGRRRVLDRRLAIALRCEGRLRDAEVRIDALLEDSTDPVERARLLSDKALITMGIERVEGLALPEHAARTAFLATIERARPILMAATAVAAPTPSAFVALALPVVANRGASEAERLEATERMRLALDAMSSDSPGFWIQTGLMPRCRFYLAVLELRSLNAALSPTAVDRLHELLKDNLEVPLDLLEDALVNAVLIDAPRVADVARLALQRHPRRMLECLDLATTIQRSSAFRHTVVDVLTRSASSMTAAERWRAWTQTLKGSLAAEERDLDAAAQALDALEELARESAYQSEFLALLEDSHRWEPAWSIHDAWAARAVLYESTGRIPEARGILRQLAHAAISEDSLTLAQDLRERMHDLGETNEDLAGIDQRLTAAARTRVASPGIVRETAVRRAQVMFLGGDERQQQYEQELRRMIGVEHPSIDLEMAFPGWGSNWGRLLERIEPQIRQSHAVVLMTFVRTVFGQRVRKLASEAGIPWVSCTGHGLLSLQRAIGRACELAEERASSR